MLRNLLNPTNRRIRLFVGLLLAGLFCIQCTRSEAIRDLIRDSLVREHVEEGGEAAGTITLIYSHDTRELTDTLTDIQHKYHNMVVSSMHIHLDGHNCLEVLVVRGKASVIQKVADRLIGTRGVKHGKLSLTATGKGF